MKPDYLLATLGAAAASLATLAQDIPTRIRGVGAVRTARFRRPQAFRLLHTGKTRPTWITACRQSGRELEAQLEVHDPPFNQSVHGGHSRWIASAVQAAQRHGRFADCLGVKNSSSSTCARLPALARRPEARGRPGGSDRILRRKQGRVLQNGSYDNSAISSTSPAWQRPAHQDRCFQRTDEGSLRAWQAAVPHQGGRLNFACASCHTHNIGKHCAQCHHTIYGDAAHTGLRTQYLLQSLQLRFAECNLDTRTSPSAGSRPYTDLECS